MGFVFCGKFRTLFVFLNPSLRESQQSSAPAVPAEPGTASDSPHLASGESSDRGLGQSLRWELRLYLFLYMSGIFLGREDKSRHFHASIEKLSEKLLEEGIETYLAIRSYVGNSDSIGELPTSRRSSSSSCSSLPPPPSTAPPPLPSL